MNEREIESERERKREIRRQTNSIAEDYWSQKIYQKETKE